MICLSRSLSRSLLKRARSSPSCAAYPSRSCVCAPCDWRRELLHLPRELALFSGGERGLMSKRSSWVELSGKCLNRTSSGCLRRPWPEARERGLRTSTERTLKIREKHDLHRSGGGTLAEGFWTRRRAVAAVRIVRPSHFFCSETVSWTNEGGGQRQRLEVFVYNAIFCTGGKNLKSLDELD